MTINAPAAEIVRRIFREWNDARGSLSGIATRLSNDGVPSPRGGDRWRQNTVRLVLTNEAYRGTAAWGRRRKGRYYARGEDGTPTKRARAAKTE